MPNNLSGQFDLVSAIEGSSLTAISPTNTDVATFSDGTLTDTAANFTATIDWGDGITTTGTVVGSNGHFTVQADHVYGDDNFYSPIATITRNTDNAQLTLFGGVNVSDVDNLSGHNQPTIVASANQALTNVVVATFTDSYTGNSASDFTTNIDWGDGTTTVGTLTGAAGSFTVTGSHTYATNGNFTITTFMNDDAPDAAFATATTQANIGFGGTEVLSAAVETIAVANGTTVATFADNSNLPSTDYTAMIDWGDGVTTAGLVSGSNGSFTVTSAADHTYTDEGNFTEVVTITRTTDNATIAPSGIVVVADNDDLNASGTTIKGDPGVALNNVTVATFSDSNTQNGAGDFVATIDWGDGSSSTGTVSGSNGSFTVNGSHTYAQNGRDNITVSIADDDQGIATASAGSTALIGLAPDSGASISATEGTAIAANTQVGTFSDSNSSDTAADFTASINWGDGTSSVGTISGSNGSFTVTGGPHTYADEGSDAVTTTVTRTADNATATILGIATVDDADNLAVVANNISGNAGQPFNNVQVATFTTGYAGNIAGDFNATINWGDGTSSTGTISGSNGSFTVNGSHTYTTGGNDHLTVTVAEDDFSSSASGSATATINLGSQMVLTSATEGTALPNNTAVATFSDSTPGDTASSFTASIDWGDGVTTAGSVVGGSGSFTVEGGHTYTDEGGPAAIVTLTRTSDQATSTVSGFVSVAEGDALTGQGATFSATAQNSFSGAVATFSDTDTATAASDFAVTVDWGDGTTAAGSVSGSNGSFTVNGSHTYATEGQFTVQVQGADDDSGTATFSATSTATVHLAGQMVLTSATEAVALGNSTAVATFSGAAAGDTASSFTASINWGDGVTTAGTVVGSSGTFTVEGGHTYADEGSDPASVTITHTSDGIQSSASGSVAVAEDDVLTPHGTTIKTKANQAFSGAVATFGDTDTANIAGDFNATIDWGDGSTTAGTVSGGSGSFTVNGTHTYTHPGHENVTVTLNDDAPGTATATAHSTANVSGAPKNDFNGDNKSDLLLQSNGSNHPDVMFELLNGTTIASSATITTPRGWAVEAAADFNNDGKSDVVVQNSDGLPQIWLMNGTTRTSTTTLANPGSAWHVIAADDFNNDGNPDLLFQNNNGAVQIWEMNGTSVASTLSAGNPGVSWHAIGAGDFNNDGNADILFQNDDGTPAIWEMNGGSVIASATLTNPGQFWHAIGTGDFNGDGNADILYQNKDGTPAIWEMNGTTVIAAATLTNPGVKWHAIGTSDFNGDGNADILYQNGDGTPAVWEMNGTSILSSFTLANPGSQWVLKDDGPIQPSGSGTHLSSPDTANPVPPLRNGFLAGLAASLPPEVASQFSTLLSNAVGAEQAFIRQLFPTST